jgi:hypothetical protein
MVSVCSGEKFCLSDPSDDGDTAKLDQILNRRGVVFQGKLVTIGFPRFTPDIKNQPENFVPG